MTGHDSPRDTSDAPRPTRQRRTRQSDPARVAASDVHQAEDEARDGATPPSPPPTATDRTAPDRQRALALRLTAPEFVAITDKQYREAVDLLAAMIVSWVQRDSADTSQQQP